MKKARIYNALSFSLLGLCVIYFIVSLFIEIYPLISYAVAVVFGMVIFSLFIRHYHVKLLLRIDWLERRARLSNDISYRVKLAGERSFNKIPLGIMILNKNDYHIEWSNDYASEIFHSHLNKNEKLLDRKISEFDKDLDAKIKAINDFEFKILDKYYHIEVLREDNIVYFTDITNLQELKEKYNDRTPAAGIISLDNFEQALSSIDAQRRAQIISDIIGILSNWCDKYGVYLRGYSEKQYLILMDRSQLDKVTVDEFDIIDDVNDYCEKENLKMTLSIAVCTFDKSVNELMEKANEYLTLALNRGGNQAVVFVDEKIKYYGGKAIGSSSIDTVQVRFKAEELRDCMLESDKVIVMAHRNTDADALAGSIAVSKIAKALGLETYVIYNENISDVTVREVMAELKTQHIDLVGNFISPSKAISMMTEKTLLVICDVQVVNQLLDEKVYRKAKRIAIIDHHRSSTNTISNYIYSYNSTTASSSVEMVVQLFDYIDSDLPNKISSFISQFEATMMLLGIIVDTTNLVYRTSSHTFMVLAKIQNMGAEMADAQKYLREDFSTYTERMKFLSSIQEYKSIYGIVVCDDKIYSRQYIAKIADGILNIEKFKAGFCVGRILSNVNGKQEEQVGISARSLGEENVQLIMEELGGGGHFNNSATQISGITVSEALEKLKAVLDDVYDKGDETVKVILLNDVKQKGKKGDIVDLNSGYANHLIRIKDAILATPDNVNELKRQNDIEKIKAQQYLEEMRELKEKIENGSIYCSVKVGAEGKIFGTVSTKTIIDELKNQLDVTIDKKKMIITLPNNDKINALGEYEVTIQLHKEVSAKLKVFVVESK